MSARMMVYELDPPTAAQIVVDVAGVDAHSARLNLLGPDGQYVEDLSVLLSDLGPCIRRHATTWQAGTVFLRAPDSLPLALTELAAWTKVEPGAALQAAE